MDPIYVYDNDHGQYRIERPDAEFVRIEPPKTDISCRHTELRFPKGCRLEGNSLYLLDKHITGTTANINIVSDSFVMVECYGKCHGRNGEKSVELIKTLGYRTEGCRKLHRVNLSDQSIVYLERADSNGDIFFTLFDWWLLQIEVNGGVSGIGCLSTKVPFVSTNNHLSTSVCGSVLVIVCSDNLVYLFSCEKFKSPSGIGFCLESLGEVVSDRYLYRLEVDKLSDLDGIGCDGKQIRRIFGNSVGNCIFVLYQNGALVKYDFRFSKFSVLTNNVADARFDCQYGNVTFFIITTSGKFCYFVLEDNTGIDLIYLEQYDDMSFEPPLRNRIKSANS